MELDYPVIIIIIGLCIIAVLVTIREITSQREIEMDQQRAAAQYHDRAARAVWAGATIISARNCNPRHELGGKAMVDLRMQVNAPDHKTYIASTSWLVDATALPALQPGQHIPVKIDQMDEHIIYPHMTGMEFIPRKNSNHR
jgi:hypothetical protein